MPHTIIPIDSFWVNLDSEVASLTVHPNNNKLYLGQRTYQSRHRYAISALTLSSGIVSGEPGFYKYSPDEITNVNGQYVGIYSSLVNQAKQRLYVTIFEESTIPDHNKQLGVLDLGSNGEPTGVVRSYNLNSAAQKGWHGIAKHSTLDYLYIVGQHQAGVDVYQLDSSGDPLGMPTFYSFGGFGKHSIAINSAGDKLYLGRFSGTIDVIPLNTGVPNIAGASSHTTALAANEYMRIVYSSKAIYFRTGTLTNPKLAYWTLSGGLPVGTGAVDTGIRLSESFSEAFGTAPIQSFAVSPDESTLYVVRKTEFNDAISGTPTVDGCALYSYSLDASGVPSSPVLLQAIEAYKCCGVKVGVDGRVYVLTEKIADPVVNKVGGETFRFTITSVTPPGGPYNVDFYVPGTSTVQGTISGLAIGTPSADIALNPALTNLLGNAGQRCQCRLTANGVNADDVMSIRVEIKNSAGTVHTTKNQTVTGNLASLSFPSYAWMPSSERLSEFQTLPEMFAEFKSQSALIAATKGPKLFTLNLHNVVFGGGNSQAITDGMNFCKDLGANCANPYDAGGLAGATVAAARAAANAKKIQHADTTPGTFGYLPSMTDAGLTSWANGLVNTLIARSGCVETDIIQVSGFDEPGSNYSQIVFDINNTGTALSQFQTWLQTQEYSPGVPLTFTHLGYASWAAVRAVDQTNAVAGGATSEQKANWYWTWKYSIYSYADGQRRARIATETRLGHTVFFPNTYALNFSNWVINQSYWASTVASLAGFRPDFYLAGQNSDYDCGLEDHVGDQYACVWSPYADAIRCAATKGARDFAPLIIAGRIGAIQTGLKLRVLHLLARGMKHIDLYGFGPLVVAPNAMWGQPESDELLPFIARLAELVADIEPFTFTGVPVRGKVALQVGGVSSIWDTTTTLSKLYATEATFLHTALTHKGYTVDFVDDQDIIDGRLASRGYSVLYITMPNIHTAAYNKIVSWVNSGGYIVATPGAGTKDEYNNATSLLEPVLGVTGRAEDRTEYKSETNWRGEAYSNTLIVNDQYFGNSSSVKVKGPVFGLIASTATVVATFSASQKAITRNNYGSGKGFAFGFYPGWTYWLTPERYWLHWGSPAATRLPTDWGVNERLIATGAVIEKGTVKDVITSAEGVVAVRLRCALGDAIYLFNETGQAQNNVKVSYNLPNAVSPVITSANSAILSSGVEGSLLNITLNLSRDGYDVLLINTSSQIPVIPLNKPVKFNDLINRMKTNILEVSGIGKVDVYPGGNSDWAKNGSSSPYWYLDVIACKQEIDSIPGTRRQMTGKRSIVLSLEGWLPYSDTEGTAEKWRDKIDEVLTQIEKDIHLGLQTVIVGAPYTGIDDYQIRSSLHQGDVQTLCHYCRILIPIDEFYHFSTE